MELDAGTGPYSSRWAASVDRPNPADLAGAGEVVVVLLPTQDFRLRLADQLGGLGLALVIGIAFATVPGYLLAVFGMTEPQVAAIGTQLLRFLAVSGLFITVALTYTGGLQSTGDTKSPLYISIVSQVVVPLGLYVFFQTTGELEAHEIWSAIVVGHVIRCLLSVGRFRQQKWRTIRVDIEPARP